jgi:ArsR family transcriptional regulator, arsenate/arsenite/antimonite-responsive transcriptional repressor
MRNRTPVDTGESVTVPVSERERSADVAQIAGGTPAECAPHCSVPLTTARLSEDQAVELSTVFKAMAHPTRVQLMNLLVGSPFAVCAYDLQTAMGMPQSTISHHLKLLVTSGLVHRQQRGIWAYYSINVSAMKALSLVISLDDVPQPLSPAALRDELVEPDLDAAGGRA